MSSEVATEARPVATPVIEDWTTIPWRTLEVRVFRLQKRIFRAQRRGNGRAVHSLQRLLRRVLIAKPGKPGEFRPLGIPVLLDRAHQCLAKQALEPQWESRFEGDSYGFRPGRSPREALEAIFLTISRKAKYVLDAGIAGCFDNISHRALLTKLDTFPALRRTIKGWLEAGVVHEEVFSPTSSGVPQGEPSPRC